MQKKKKPTKDYEDTAVAKKPKTDADQNKEAHAFIEALRKSGYIGDSSKKIDCIPTGSWVINRLIGDGTLQDKPGGVPRGGITEVCGDEATGKTTLGLSISKQAQSMGGCVVYADFAQTLRTQRQYVENMGVNVNPPNFIHLIPTNFEDGVQIIGQSLIKLRPSLIVIDDVTSMISKATLEGSPDDPMQIGIHARLTGHFLNWMSKKLPKYNCALLLLNQMRSAIKGQYDPGPKEVSSGGRAVRFFSTVRIHLKQTSDREEISVNSTITGLSEKKAVSQTVKVVVEKNKLDMPFKSGPIYITFGRGIDNIMSLIVLGINKKVIKKDAAGWFSWKDPNGELGFKLQGKNSIKSYLENNANVLDALSPYLMPTQDFKEIDDMQQQLESKGIDNLSIDEKEQLRDIRKAKGLPTDDLDFTEDEISDLAELTGKDE